MDVRIRLALKIVDEHAGVVNTSPEQMAALLGLSKVRLLRLFNIEMGKTFRRHLLEVRMKHAAGMLTDYMLPIKTIASRFGYTEVSNFYRDFKIVHGISPAQMRLSLMDLPSARPSAVHRAFGTFVPQQARGSLSQSRA